MNAEHQKVAALLAVLSIPFGIAIYEDATGKHSHASALYGDLDGDWEMYEPYGSGGYEEDYYRDFEDDFLDGYEVHAEAAEEEPAVMDTDFFREVLFDGGKATHPTLSGPLANIEIGMSEARFVEVAPNYDDWAFGGLPRFEGATVMPEFREGKLDTLTIDFVDDGSALDVLSGQWGLGADVQSVEEYSWFSPEKSLQATYSYGYGEASLTFSRYQTLEEFVAPSRVLFGFETKDALTLSEEEVMELSSDSDYGDTSVELPALPESGEPLSAYYELDGETVDSVSIGLELPSEDRERLLNLLKRKLGKGKTSGDDYETVHTFKQGRRVVEWSVDDLGYGALTIRRP